MPAQAVPNNSPDQLIDTIVAAIMARHPEFDAGQVRAEVSSTYTRLARGSRISEHLPVLIQHEVTERLRTPAHR